MSKLQFVPAGTYTLPELADIFSRSFEDYFYPGQINAELLARRVREEQLDLWYSPVMVVDNQPAGQALLGRCGSRAWCGGFGVLKAFRGQGLAHPLAEHLLTNARQAGASTLTLEVLTRNTAAISTYTRAGFKPKRDLLIVEWQRPAGQSAQIVPDLVHEVSVSRALEQFGVLHPVPAAWQRDLPSLLTRSDLRCLAVEEHGSIRAYTLFRASDTTSARIIDLGAIWLPDAQLLLQALQQSFDRLISVNEPANSHLTAAFAERGFSESDRQHEMFVDLER